MVTPKEFFCIDTVCIDTGVLKSAIKESDGPKLKRRHSRRHPVEVCYAGQEIYRYSLKIYTMRIYDLRWYGERMSNILFAVSRFNIAETKIYIYCFVDWKKSLVCFAEIVSTLFKMVKITK